MVYTGYTQPYSNAAAYYIATYQYQLALQPLYSIAAILLILWVLLQLTFKQQLLRLHG